MTAGPAAIAASARKSAISSGEDRSKSNRRAIGLVEVKGASFARKKGPAAEPQARCKAIVGMWPEGVAAWARIQLDELELVRSPHRLLAAVHRHRP